MASIKISNLYKSFEKNKNVVDDFNLQIEDGEFIVLVGPSGCGKSTLLRIVAGLEYETSGSIHIGKDLVNDIPAKNRNIAMVFQNYALYPHMNVYQNLAFGLKLRKTEKSEIERLVQQAADILEIGDYLHRKPKELSGGQRQRVALGRAIVRDPQVFLFDEPLSNLDAKLRVQMRAEIKKLHKRLGTTMVYVTHDQVEAMTMGDRIVVMKDGFIQQVGSPDTVFHSPANKFVGSFIGSPPMNFIKGKVDGEFLDTGKYRFPLGTSGKLSEMNQKEIIIGVRPTDIHIGKPGVELPLLVAEPLGDESIVHLELGADTLIIRVASELTNNLTDQVPVSFAPEKLHYFDALSEKRISL